MPENKTLEQTFFTTKFVDTHQPNALTNCGGKRIQYIHSRDDPFRETIVSIMGLIESRDLVSQDGEDSLGGSAGLKAGKERERCKVFFSFTFIRFQSGIENG
jgi:hypothetical protein